MVKKNDYRFIAVIAIMAGLYFIVADEYVYKYEKYYLGDSLITKSIAVKKDPEFIKGNLFSPAHYNIRSKEYQSKFRISDGALAQVVATGSITQIENIKIGDSLTIKYRISDESNLMDSTTKIRIIDLINNNQQLIIAASVEKYDRKSYHTSIGFGIVLLVIGLLWLLARAFRKRNL